MDFGEQIASGLDESLHVVGGDLTATRVARRWDLFAGGAALIRHRDAPELDVPALEGVDYVGHALFVANNFYIGDGTTLVVEAKHYRDFLLAVQPTRIQIARRRRSSARISRSRAISIRPAGACASITPGSRSA